VLAFSHISQAIRGNHEEKLEFPKRHLSNTLEQAALFGLGFLASSSFLSRHNASAASFVGMWLAGRFLFITGYTKANPIGREFGFDLTFWSGLLVSSLGVYDLLWTLML